MLSRVADSLYWMSRYLERAEHTARVIDVNLNLMLDESASARNAAGSACWRRSAIRRDIEWNGDVYALVAYAVLRYRRRRPRSRPASSRRARMRARCASRSAPSSGSG